VTSCIKSFLSEGQIIDLKELYLGKEEEIAYEASVNNT
jgi:hypothetical protein